jgi:hypothetical protein
VQFKLYLEDTVQTLLGEFGSKFTRIVLEGRVQLKVYWEGTVQSLLGEYGSKFTQRT